jgi:hypothetical protein
MKTLYNGAIVICELVYGAQPEETFIDSAYYADTGEELSNDDIVILQLECDAALDEAHYEHLIEVYENE